MLNVVVDDVGVSPVDVGECSANFLFSYFNYLLIFDLLNFIFNFCIYNNTL